MAAQVNELIGEIMKERRRYGELVNIKYGFGSVLLSLEKEDKLNNAKHGGCLVGKEDFCVFQF